MNFPKTQHKFSKAQIFSLAFPSCSNLRNCETCVTTPTSHKEIPHVPFVRLTRIPLRNIKKLRFSQEEAPPKEKNRNTETLPPPFFCVPKNPCSCEQGYFLHKMFSKSSQTSPQYHCFFPHQPPITLRFLLLFSVNGIITSTNNSRNNIYLPSSTIQPLQKPRQA